MCCRNWESLEIIWGNYFFLVNSFLYNFKKKCRRPHNIKCIYQNSRHMVWFQFLKQSPKGQRTRMYIYNYRSQYSLQQPLGWSIWGWDRHITKLTSEILLGWIFYNNILLRNNVLTKLGYQICGKHPSPHISQWNGSYLLAGL